MAGTRSPASHAACRVARSMRIEQQLQQCSDPSIGFRIGWRTRVNTARPGGSARWRAQCARPLAPRRAVAPCCACAGDAHVRRGVALTWPRVNWLGAGGGAARGDRSRRQRYVARSRSPYVRAGVARGVAWRGAAEHPIFARTYDDPTSDRAYITGTSHESYEWIRIDHSQDARSDGTKYSKYIFFVFGLQGQARDERTASNLVNLCTWGSLLVIAKVK